MRCAWQQKRGKRAGMLCKARLANMRRVTFHSIFLANISALDEMKLDLIRLRLSTYKEMRNCSVHILTETWLRHNIPDTAVQNDGLLLFRADRNKKLTGKSKGGGLCKYIN